MTEIELVQKMHSAGLSLTAAGSVNERREALEKALKMVIPPKNLSDRTCFRRVRG
jgi:hypothetical protein